MRHEIIDPSQLELTDKVVSIKRVNKIRFFPVLRSRYCFSICKGDITKRISDT